MQAIRRKKIKPSSPRKRKLSAGRARRVVSAEKIPVTVVFGDGKRVKTGITIAEFASAVRNEIGNEETLEQGMGKSFPDFAQKSLKAIDDHLLTLENSLKRMESKLAKV